MVILNSDLQVIVGCNEKFLKLEISEGQAMKEWKSAAEGLK